MTTNTTHHEKPWIVRHLPTLAVVALGVLAVGHGIGALKHLRDGEWPGVAISFALTAIYATAAHVIAKHTERV